MQPLPPTLQGMPPRRLHAALWACALHDAARGNTRALCELVASHPMPRRHCAAVAELLARLPAPKKGRRSPLGSADVIAILDYRDRHAKTHTPKQIKHELAPRYHVSPDTIADVLACRKTFAWARVLKYRSAQSSATFTIGGSAAGTVTRRRKAP